MYGSRNEKKIAIEDVGSYFESKESVVHSKDLSVHLFILKDRTKKQSAGETICASFPEDTAPPTQCGHVTERRPDCVESIFGF